MARREETVIASHSYSGALRLLCAGLQHRKSCFSSCSLAAACSLFTLNNSHFSLLKKERDKLAPGARFARSGWPLAASFFLQKREMRVVECKRSVANGYRHGFVPVFFVLLASVAGLCVVFGAVKWRDVRTLLPVSSFCGGSFAGFAKRLQRSPSFALVFSRRSPLPKHFVAARLPPHHFRSHVRMLRCWRVCRLKRVSPVAWRARCRVFRKSSDRCALICFASVATSVRWKGVT